MSRLNRIGVVYRKDLIDALRDRRTLMAMVGVPVVLYPVLMIVVVQALTVEKKALERQNYRVAVPDEAHATWLKAIIQHTHDESEGDGGRRRGLEATIAPDRFEFEVTTDSPEECVRELGYHAYVQLDPPPNELAIADDEGDQPNRTVRVYYDQAEVTGRVAQRALWDLIESESSRIVARRLEDVGIDQAFLSPLSIQSQSLASPEKLGGALLGQIMPFLLVIITVTGAIYPAIDLTAGERERGTLETLMAAPVPTMQLVVGKFLVIVTISMVITVLNLLSIGMTFQFGGLNQALSQIGESTSIPFRVLPMIIFAMVPFVVLFSAIMLAVCSFARTFKEAQNYMMPVIVAAMLPAMVVSYMPTLHLSNMLAVTPVANVVALLREMFLGKFDPMAISLVLGSTALYAAAAVVLATSLYGKEAVLFTDVGSYRTLFDRRLIRPQRLPSSAMSLMLLAMVFPIQFYWQSGLLGSDFTGQRLAWVLSSCQVLIYLLPVLALTLHFRINIVETLSLRSPRLVAGIGVLLIALFVGPMSMMLTDLQQRMTGAQPSPEMQRLSEIASTLPLWSIVVVFALVPAVCEEILFRGFLLAGLRTRLRPIALCLAVGVLFGLYHVSAEKLVIVSLMGVLLSFVCWRSGSIFAAMLIHFCNNAFASLIDVEGDGWSRHLATIEGNAVHLAGWLQVAAPIAVLAGLILIAMSPQRSRITTA